MGLEQWMYIRHAAPLASNSGCILELKTDCSSLEQRTAVKSDEWCEKLRQVSMVTENIWQIYLLNILLLLLLLLLMYKY